MAKKFEHFVRKIKIDNPDQDIQKEAEKISPFSNMNDLKKTRVPLPKNGQYELVFFPFRFHNHEHYNSLEDSEYNDHGIQRIIEMAYEAQGLVPINPYMLLALNKEDPKFAFQYPHMALLGNVLLSFQYLDQEWIQESFIDVLYEDGSSDEEIERYYSGFVTSGEDTLGLEIFAYTDIDELVDSLAEGSTPECMFAGIRK